VLVGIDIEQVNTERDGFEAIAFAPHEQQLVSTLDADARREWHLRMWCAKEAAGKAIGRGLSSGIGALRVFETRMTDGAIRLRLDAGLAEEFPAWRDRGLQVMTAREGDLVSSTLVTQR